MLFLDFEFWEWVSGGVRAIMYSFSTGLYELASDVYNFIYKLAMMQIFTEGTINTIAGNIYSLLGIIMIFFLAINVLQYIINPDKISDKKNGAGQIVTGIVTSVILILIFPYVFAFLFNLQNAILTDNILQNLFVPPSTNVQPTTMKVSEKICSYKHSSGAGLKYTITTKPSTGYSTVYGNNGEEMYINAYVVTRKNGDVWEVGIDTLLGAPITTEMGVKGKIERHEINVDLTQKCPEQLLILERYAPLFDFSLETIINEDENLDFDFIGIANKLLEEKRGFYYDWYSSWDDNYGEGPLETNYQVIIYFTDGTYHTDLTKKHMRTFNFDEQESVETEYEEEFGSGDILVRSVFGSFIRCDSLIKDAPNNGNLNSKNACSKLESIKQGKTEMDSLEFFLNQRFSSNTLKDVDNYESDTRFAIQFDAWGLVSFIASGILLLFVIVTCFDVALRSVKLAFLRILAPIFFISYATPSTRKIFNNWLSTFFTTYLDLFIRLIIVYFLTFVVSNIDFGDTFLFRIFTIFGLLSFAKIAPKFIGQIFGVKDLAGSFTLNPFQKLREMPLVGGAMGAAAQAAGTFSANVRTYGFRGAMSGKNLKKSFGVSNLAAGFNANGGLMGVKEGDTQHKTTFFSARKAYEDKLEQKNQAAAQTTNINRITDAITGGHMEAASTGKDAKKDFNLSRSSGQTKRGSNYITPNKTTPTANSMEADLRNIRGNVQNVDAHAANIEANTSQANTELRTISGATIRTANATEDIRDIHADEHDSKLHAKRVTMAEKLDESDLDERAEYEAELEAEREARIREEEMIREELEFDRQLKELEEARKRQEEYEKEMEELEIKNEEAAEEFRKKYEEINKAWDEDLEESENDSNGAI